MIGPMPGRNRVEPADPLDVLDAVVTLKNDIMNLRPRVASGEVDQKEALDRVLGCLLELAAVTESLVLDYKKRRSDV